MRDHADLIRRAALAKQGILLALRHANEAALDGSRDPEDLAALAAASDQVRMARDALDTLRKRLEFVREMERIASGNASDDGSRMMLNAVRLGVDGGYQVEEVRKIVDTALARRGVAGTPPSQ